MKEGLNAWWKRRPRLRRGHRTALDLVVCALLLLLFWGQNDYPLPTLELEFRRLERTHLCQPSDIVFNSDMLETLEQLGRPNLTLRDEWVVGSASGNVRAMQVQGDYSVLYTYPLEAGPTPVPFFHGTATLFWSGNVRATAPLLFLNIPEGSRGELELTATDWQGVSRSYQGEGWNLGSGRWLFATEPGPSFPGDWYAGGDYALTLYGADGVQISRWTGVIPLQGAMG